MSIWKYDVELDDYVEKDPIEYAMEQEQWYEEQPYEQEPYPCDDCRHAPPSSFDGKPCSACDPNDELLSCYDRLEDTP